MARTEQRLTEERKRYVQAFNNTMIAIWKEKIAKLRIIDTGWLFSSLQALPPVLLSTDYSAFTLSEQFPMYGVYVDRGTGREVPRGNPGDIGRDKVRQARPWFYKKYYASVMNLKDFMAENLGDRFVAIMAEALTDKKT